MIYYLNSLPGSGSDLNIQTLFNNGEWYLDEFTINPSSQAPYGYEINQDGYIVSLSTTSGSRNSGFVILPKVLAKKYLIMFVLNNDNSGCAQYGRCTRDADAYACQAYGTNRYSYTDVGAYAGNKIYSETTGVNEGEFIAFGKGISIKCIYYISVDTI